MKTVFFICILFASLIISDCNAQKILVFDRDGHVRRIRFHIQDEIAVRTADNSLWEYGEITDIGDSTITISDTVIFVSKIKAIRFESQGGGTNLLRQATLKLPAAAVVLLAFDAINTASNNPRTVVYSKSTLITAGALIIAGPIAYFFTFHKYKINKRHRLKVIDVSVR